VIEAFDQPWKRYLEGTVGGYWGLLDDGSRRQKFIWGAAVSNHRHWPWQAAGGVVLVALVFAAAICARRGAKAQTATAWFAISLEAAIGGVLAGWSVENVPIESFDIGGWVRSLFLATLSIVAPVVGGAALAAGQAPPTFAGVLGGKHDRARDPLLLTLGVMLIVLTVLAVQSALALSFDPRYRDFPFAPLTAAAAPVALTSVLAPRAGGRPLAETVAAAVLLLSAIFVVWHERAANWQALWFGLSLVLVAISLLRARAAPG
jgi:glucan 1,3-beta-glucosidase